MQNSQAKAMREEASVPTYLPPTKSAMTSAQLMHFYAGMITRALEQNRLRPIVVPLFDGYKIALRNSLNLVGAQSVC